MRSLPFLQLAAVIALSAWFWLNTYRVSPLPDWRQGELVALVPPAAMETESAFETELAELFARQLQVKLKTVPLPLAQTLPALTARQAHLATAVRRNSDPALHYGDAYQSLDELVICRDNTPDNLARLAGRQLVVAAASAGEAALRAAQRKQSGLAWQTRDGTTPGELLQAMADGELDCTVANREQLASARNYFPDLGEALDLGQPTALSWAFARDGDPQLLAEAQKFFARIRQDGTLRRLIDRYYGYNERLNAVNAEAFISQSRALLPRYRHLFQEAADLTGLDWMLLAALAYQESHWNPDATSYTNVRGMMMLTEETADRMRVENRLDARASVLAGARYLQMLKEQLPLRMHEDDRLWMALAAYNVGMGHLEDARVLALQSGLNPDVWSDVKRALPLLARADYAPKTKHGKARGGEAVILVETVRLYYDMLKRMEAQNAPDSSLSSGKSGLLGKLLRR